MNGIHFKNPERCTRCERPFEPGGMLFMVRENVVWRAYLHLAEVMTQTETVPVCGACVTPEERARARDELRCPGCERILSVEAAKAGVLLEPLRPAAAPAPPPGREAAAVRDL